MRYGIRQADLAQMLGYEQSYISALEIGVKGPPTEEFLDRLIRGLKLGEEEQAALKAAAQESKRKYFLPAGISVDAYRMCSELFRQLQDLHPAQIQMIRNVIGLRRQLGIAPGPDHGRVRRMQKEIAEM
jgi:transcriptional regulator with XRE-family HTH domain